MKASGPTIVATSRQPLGVAGEQVWPVRGLDRVDAAALFDVRAHAANRNYDAGTHPHAVAELCDRLDGLPLAIELAAARVRSLTPTEIASRLDRSLEFLQSAGLGTEARHVSVRATIEWSLNLLSSPERILFARLAVFAGTFDLAAVEHVCALGMDTGFEDLDLMASLVDKSLVVAETRGTTTRFRLLEPLRQYGTELLAVGDEAQLLAERHAAHYVNTAEQARAWYEGTEPERGREAFAAEWDNLRVALHQSVATGAAQRVDGLLDAAYHYAAFSYRSEYGEWAELAMTMATPPPTAYAACGYWQLSSEPSHALELAQQGLRVCEAQPDADAALCWFLLAAADYYTGAVDTAWIEVGRYEQARQARGGKFRAAHAAGIVATIATVADPPAAPEHIRRAARIAHRLNNPTMDAWLVHLAGLAASAIGDHVAARELYRRAVAEADHDVNPLAYTQATLAIAMRAPPTDRTRAYREAIERLHATHAATDMWVLLESLAAHWATSGQIEASAVLFGHLGARGYQFAATEPRRRRALAAIEAQPASDEWTAAGAELDASEIIAFALRTLDDLT